MSELVPIADPARDAPRHSVLRTGLGFRPFFLLAGLAAALMIPLWLAALEGWWRYGTLSWHTHEMVFGFAVAVIAGFLLTAVPRWTDTRALCGPPLWALAAVWLAGRVVVALAPVIEPWIVLAVDGAFVPVLAVAVGWPIYRVRRTRNYGIPPILLAVGAGNIALHLTGMGLAYEWRERSLGVAVYAICTLIAVVGGRVTPFFTRGRLGDAVRLRSFGALDIAALAAVAALIPLAALVPGSLVFAIVAIVAGVLNGIRMVGWGAVPSLRVPLLWILHLGYAWLAVGLLLTGVAALRPDLVPPPTALHALTAGSIGAYILGMMARVSLGHTGRPLVADRVTVAAFAMMAMGGVVRVGGPLLGSAVGSPAVRIAGLLWAGAFLIYCARFAPVLLTPRPDGRPG